LPRTSREIRVSLTTVVIGLESGVGGEDASGRHGRHRLETLADLDNGEIEAPVKGRLEGQIRQLALRGLDWAFDGGAEETEGGTLDADYGVETTPAERFFDEAPWDRKIRKTWPGGRGQRGSWGGII